MNIILLAAPGAGKGTQADLISKKFGLKHVSTGDLLRKALLNDNKMADLIKQEMENGGLVSDNIVLMLVKDVLKQEKNGVIFDGFPRTIKQAKMLDELLLEENQKIDLVINIIVDKMILKNRIIGRLICSECRAIYNDNFVEHRPKKTEICDKCDSRLIHRKDDTAEIFESRYQTYLSETEPLINYYKDLDILIEVENVSNTYREIFDKIEKILEGGK